MDHENTVKIVTQYANNENNHILQLQEDDINNKSGILCRTCLRVLPQNHSITIIDQQFVHKLSNIANIKLMHLDILRSICVDCTDLINTCFAFKQLCEKSDHLISNVFHKQDIQDWKISNDIFQGVRENVSIEEILADINNEILTDCKDDFESVLSNTLNSANIKSELNVDSSLDKDALDLFDNTSMDILECNASDDFSLDTITKSKSLKDVAKNGITVTAWTNNVTRRKKDKKKSATVKNTEESDKRESESYICNKCGKIFTGKKRLKRHERIHLSVKPFTCNKCGKGFIESGDLKRHSKIHNPKMINKPTDSTSENQIPCPLCQLTFSSEEDLTIHSAVHQESEDIRCLHCNKQFKYKTQLRRHVKIHLIDKPHKCKMCNKGFPEKGALTKHFKKIHSGEFREKKHVCKLCNKSYFDRHALNIHERIHTGEKPWICSDCGKRFIDARLLHSHMKIHSDVRPYFCSICNKSFKHESTLITHVRTHTGEKPYVCSVCGHSFIQTSNLALHMRTHTKERPYQCEFCSKRFASSSALRCHIRIHTGEKPYACKLCDKKFTRYDMSAHMKVHSGEKCSNCSTCNKRFATTAQLNYHLKMHNGERPFPCAICGKSYATSSHLKKHLSKTHQVLAVDTAPNLNALPKLELVVDGTSNLTNMQKIELPPNCEIISPVMDDKGVASHEFVSAEMISCSQAMTLDGKTCTLNVIRLDENGANINISTDDVNESALEHQLRSDTGEVSSNIQILTDDKLFQIDSNLLRLHHITAANLVESGELTIREMTDNTT